MAIQPGTYELGPQDGKLLVRTGKGGAASKAGHNLVIEVERWGATVQFADDPAQSVLELNADSTSFTVMEGTGGVKSLGDDDKEGIAQTINQEVLKGTPISLPVHRGASRRRRPAPRHRRSGAGQRRQSDRLRHHRLRGRPGDRQRHGQADEWGMKPYSALFGTLKVADEVGVEIDAKLRPTG